jgi:hypothetical protein
MRKDFLEAIWKIFSTTISFREILWKEDARVLWTQVGKHNDGGIWKYVFAVVELCGIYKIGEGENKRVLKCTTIFLQRKSSIWLTQDSRKEH